MLFSCQNPLFLYMNFFFYEIMIFLLSKYLSEQKQKLKSIKINIFQNPNDLK
jgi:hypothetical protein